MQSITEEIWKPVVGYESIYEVSSLGNLRRLPRIKYVRNQVGVYPYTMPIQAVKVSFAGDGYGRCTLNDGVSSKMKLIHRLVAEAFLSNPDNLPEVNHKDRNKRNNCVDNLEWITKIDNMHHAMKSGWDPGASRRGSHNSLYQIECTKKARLGVKSSESLKYYLRHSHVNQSIPCSCVEDNINFATMEAAARYYQIDPTTVKHSMDVGRAARIGKTFVRDVLPGSKHIDVPRD